MSRPVRLGEPLAELRRTDPPVQRLAGLVAREDVQVEHDPASKRDTFPHAFADAAGGTYSQLYVVRCLSCRFRILPFPLL